MSETDWRLPNRVAYVVSHSRPWSSNGYALRGDAVARALLRAGHEVIVFSRPGRPWDIDGFPAATEVVLDQTIDGLRYIALPMPPIPGAKRIERVRVAADLLTEAFGVFRPAAVLGASNWETAEPARRAAARTGAAFFYEQRGFWAMGAGAESAVAREERDRETEIALAAREVYTLNGPMRDELVRRGVPPGRIALVPNGFDPRPRLARRVTREMIGCRSRWLLGYIGSLSPYEGVEDLIRLVAQLRGGAAPLDVDALILGSDVPKGLLGGAAGPAQQRLRALAQDLGVTDHIHFVPQLPEAEANAHYPLCDAMVMPRRRTPVTELVPPLKPYTAAAHGLPVFMTDLPPLAEIAAEIHGILFPEGELETLAGLVRRELTEGGAALQAQPPAALDWARRVRPISDALAAVAIGEQARNARIFAGAALAVAPPPVSGGFDLAALPRVGLHSLIGAPQVALIGPGDGAETAGGRLIRLRRADLLEELATAPPGHFIIDWAGLRAGDGLSAGEWAGLWSIDDMRLNRLMMDAVRIARQRGWRVQVTGPVHRSEAPLFRTVAALVEEILPAGPLPGPLPQEGGA